MKIQEFDEGTVGRERQRLNFAHHVERKFRFLTEAGFIPFEMLPTIVKYKKGHVVISIFHGRRSFEMGIEIGFGADTYSLSEIIRSVDIAEWERFRNPTARTNGEVASGLDRLVDLFNRYGLAALRGGATYFADLKEKRKAGLEAYAFKVRSSQIRRKASAAFQEGRYADVVALYQEIESVLSLVEKKRLAIARKRG
jgi:hypothetical protein